LIAFFKFQEIFGEYVKFAGVDCGVSNIQVSAFFGQVSEVSTNSRFQPQ